MFQWPFKILWYFQMRVTLMQRKVKRGFQSGRPSTTRCSAVLTRIGHRSEPPTVTPRSCQGLIHYRVWFWLVLVAAFTENSDNLQQNSGPYWPNLQCVHLLLRPKTSSIPVTLCRSFPSSFHIWRTQPDQVKMRWWTDPPPQVLQKWWMR